jgi:hypothetical protein
LLPEFAVEVTDKPGQKSEITGWFQLTGQLQAPDAAVTVMFAGQLIIGAHVSCTLTVYVIVLVTPLLSVATTFISFVPTGRPYSDCMPQLPPGKFVTVNDTLSPFSSSFAVITTLFRSSGIVQLSVIGPTVAA